jgi:hypothetical protein
MVTDRDGPRPYWIHLVWTAYFFLYILAFWWWEFQFASIEWSFSLYLMIAIYATLLFFVSIILHPSSLNGVRSYKEYYYLNRRWLFGLLIAITLWDIVDTLFKGADYLLSLGWNWRLQHVGLVLMSIVGIATAKERYHQVIAIVCLAMTLNMVRAYLAGS